MIVCMNILDLIIHKFLSHSFSLKVPLLLQPGSSGGQRVNKCAIVLAQNFLLP